MYTKIKSGKIPHSALSDDQNQLLWKEMSERDDVELLKKLNENISLFNHWVYGSIIRLIEQIVLNNAIKMMIYIKDILKDNTMQYELSDIYYIPYEDIPLYSGDVAMAGIKNLKKIFELDKKPYHEKKIFQGFYDPRYVGKQLLNVLGHKIGVEEAAHTSSDFRKKYDLTGGKIKLLKRKSIKRKLLKRKSIKRKLLKRKSIKRKLKSNK